MDEYITYSYEEWLCMHEQYIAICNGWSDEPHCVITFITQVIEMSEFRRQSPFIFGGFKCPKIVRSHLPKRGRG
jgi:hypothetical protein